MDSSSPPARINRTQEMLADPALMGSSPENGRTDTTLRRVILLVRVFFFASRVDERLDK